ncbi:transcriptional regulator [Patescibacteria group bacterium]
MLGPLFSSKVRLKLLSLFLLNPDKAFYVRELTRRLDERINSVRRELDNLRKMGLLVSHTENRRKYYMVDRKFELYEELRALMLKAGVTPQEKAARQLQALRGVQLAVLSGVFTQQNVPKTDLLVVGNPPKPKLRAAVSELEKGVGKPVRYAVIDKDEYDYRTDMRDQFLHDILSNENIKVVNRIQAKAGQKVKAKK